MRRWREARQIRFRADSAAAFAATDDDVPFMMLPATRHDAAVATTISPIYRYAIYAARRLFDSAYVFSPTPVFFSMIFSCHFSFSHT
jgi:hypothetical protein